MSTPEEECVETQWTIYFMYPTSYIFFNPLVGLSYNGISKIYVCSWLTSWSATIFDVNGREKWLHAIRKVVAFTLLLRCFAAFISLHWGQCWDRAAPAAPPLNGSANKLLVQLAFSSYKFGYSPKLTIERNVMVARWQEESEDWCCFPAFHFYFLFLHQWPVISVFTFWAIL